MYGESPSGLGAEEVRFDAGKFIRIGDSTTEERWIHAINAWDDSGSPGGKPPGVGQLAPLLSNSSVKTRDYSIKYSAYFLRPEVSGILLVLIAPFLHPFLV